MKKYYAVKSGRKPGVYLTWDECREQVSGYSGAVYKSFADRDAAKAFVTGEDHGDHTKTTKCGNGTEKDRTDRTAVYVDGSYDKQTGEFSFGAVVLSGGEERTFSQKFEYGTLSEMHNVAGELKGAEFAMRYCAEHGINAVDLYYDYEGIAAWANGHWKTNKDGTKAYKAFYDEIKGTLDVNFVKVKGHSGDKYNDLADKLAKGALGK